MDEQKQLQIVQLVLAAMEGDQLALQMIEQIKYAAQQGDLLAIEIALMIEQVSLQLAQAQPAQGTPELQAAGALTARNGAKLNYIKYLRGQCPAGYEMQMFRKGGAVCKKCVKKAEQGVETPQVTSSGNSTIDQFRCGRKMKKKEQGGTVEEAKCGNKLAKKPMMACGGKSKKKTKK